eukprot:gnl/MRDRNA2_/MRDRNA2_113422_c0_seq1.p1 gnl/MRDRNA2_/MRDRNA2_113422_c0~~gnl/MRDRNA2_/MRDRNA2_113422_c0_seq1.p1  ORF type:complete len:464 (-),score=97.13 gnl/MRDRNA2_/MRDRNA2_113422_c0_seq1:126-1517(-)
MLFVRFTNSFVSLFLLTGTHCLEPQSLLQAQTKQHQQAGKFLDEQASFDCAQFQLNGTALQPRAGRTPKIFDFFLFGFEGELPVLDLRFAEMAQELDGIFIVEADTDFKGHPRQLILKEMLKKEPMNKYADQIHVIEVLLKSSPTGPAKDEYDIQRRIVDSVHLAMQKAKTLPGVTDEDFFVEGDLDEIVSREALLAVKNCQISKSPHAWPVVSVEMEQYYINLGWRDPQGWGLPSIIAPLREAAHFFKLHSATPRHRQYDASNVLNASSATVSTPGRVPLHHQHSRPHESLAVFATGSMEQVKSVPCEADDIMCGVVLSQMQQIIKQGNPAQVLRSARRAAKPVGWHLSWTLDAENTARKLNARAGGRPEWCQNLEGDELVDATRQKLIEGPKALIGANVEVNLDADSLPSAAKQDPERFRTMIGDRLYKSLQKERHLTEASLANDVLQADVKYASDAKPIP